MDGKIRAEWDQLNKVIIHRPGMEMFFGLLEPYGSLYERAFSSSEARREHEQFEHVLKHEFKIDVQRLENIIIEEADKRPEVKERLVEMAHDVFVYKGDKKDVEMAKKEFDQNAKYLDTEHFLNILLLNPGVELNSDRGTRNIHLNITERQPLSNLYFMRDQQFVTDKGIVMSRMAKPARRREPAVTEFVWREILNLPIAHVIQEPGTIEGGEFLPMGDFALVGIGDRTNRDAINQLLSIEFGFKEIAVVHQAKHPLIPGDKPDPMIDMHLDTYFNIASSNVVVGCDLLLKEAKVEIYHNEGDGKYTKDKKETNLHDYIKSKGFFIVNITTLEQMSYASNFLCIKSGHILAIEVQENVKSVLDNLRVSAKADPKRYGKLFKQAEADYEMLMKDGQFFPHKKELYKQGNEAYPIVLKNLTGGYGGAHCMTCALNRG